MWSPKGPRQQFFWVTGALLALRAALAGIIPLTGDEANFIVWAKNLAGGYHEHPPMIAWILALLLQVSDSLLWLRLPIVLLPAALGWGIFRSTKKFEIGTYIQLVPLHVIPVLMTTDTAMILFSTVSFFCFDRAIRSLRFGWFAAAGLALGCSFLGKYFGVFLAPAFLAFLIVDRAPRRAWLGFALTLLCALPAAVYHVAWNASHCWTNFRLHMSTRAFDLKGFLWMHFYLGLPFLILMRFRLSGLLRTLLKNRRASLAFFSCALPVALFGISSFTVGQSLQWSIGFYFMGYLALGFVLPAHQIGKAIHVMAVALVMHLIPVLAFFAFLPVEHWRGHPQYKNLVFFFKPEALLAEVRPLVRPGDLLVTDSYTMSSVVAYHTRTHTPVFGEGTNHGREDDRITDFRAYAHRDVALLMREQPDVRAWGAYFDSTEVARIPLAGVDFFLMRGRNFNFDLYRTSVLEKVRDRFYGPLPGLPAGPCYFSDRYWESKVD